MSLPSGLLGAHQAEKQAWLSVVILIYLVIPMVSKQPDFIPDLENQKRGVSYFIGIAISGIDVTATVNDRIKSVDSGSRHPGAHS